MNIGKSTKVTKEVTRQETNRRNNLKRITISALVAVILFISLIVIQSSILNQEEKQTVYQVIKDIPSGTKLTESNINEYLATKDVQLSLIPSDYVTDTSVLIGKYVNRNYKAKDIITIDGVTDTENIYTNNIKHPVEVSFSTSNLASSVAGILREGDYINIYGLRRVSNNLSNGLYVTDDYYSFKHVLITKAFDGSGNRVTTVENQKTLSGDSIIASIFSVIIDEKDVDLFNEMIKNCDLRITKLLYDTDEDYQAFIDRSNKGAAEASVVNNQSSSNAISSYTDYYNSLINGTVQPGNTQIEEIEPYEEDEEEQEVEETQQEIQNIEDIQNIEELPEQTQEQVEESTESVENTDSE